MANGQSRDTKRDPGKECACKSQLLEDSRSARTPDPWYPLKGGLIPQARIAFLNPEEKDLRSSSHPKQLLAKRKVIMAYKTTYSQQTTANDSDSLNFQQPLLMLLRQIFLFWATCLILL